MRRQPAKKRKRVEETDSEGDGDRPSSWSVRLWGARLYASIATTNKGITRVKEFVPTNAGEIGEMEASGKVKQGDVIWKVNDTIVTGMPSAEFMNLIRGAPRPIRLWFMRPEAPITSDSPPVEPSTTGSTAAAIVSRSHSEPIVVQSSTTSAQSVPITAVSSPPTETIMKQSMSPSLRPAGTSAVIAANSAQTAPAANNSEQSSAHARSDLTFTVPPRRPAHSTTFHPQSNVHLRHHHVEASDVRNSSSAAPPPNVHPPVGNPFMNRNGTYQQGNHGYPSGYSAPQHAVPSSVLTNMQFNGTRQHYQAPVAHQFNNSFQFRQLAWGGVPNATVNNQQSVIGQQRYNYQHNPSVRAPVANNIIQLPLQTPQSVPTNSNRQGVTWSAQHGPGSTYKPHSSNATMQPGGVQMHGYAHSAPNHSMNYGPSANQMSTGGQHSYSSNSTRAQAPAIEQHIARLPTNNQPLQARVLTSEQHIPSAQHEQQSPRTEIQRNANAIMQSSSSSSQQLQERSTPGTEQTDSTSSDTASVPEPRQTSLRIGHDNSEAQDPNEYAADDSQEPEDTSLITLDDEDSGETSFLSLDKPSFVTSLPETGLENTHSARSSQFAPRSMTGNYVVVRIERKRLQVTLGMVGSRVAVTSFVRDENGNVGEIEESGKVVVGDCVVAVNGAPIIQNTSPTEVARLVVALPRPFELYFQRASWDALHG